MSRHDPDQVEALDMLADSLSAYLSDNWSFEARRRAIAGETGWDASIWNALASELGLLAAAEAEEHGGMGLGLAAHIRIGEQLGQHLALTPYLESAVIAPALLRHGNDAARALLQQALQGTVIAPALYEPHSRYNPAAVLITARPSGDRWTLTGQKRVVRAAPWASALIVSAQTPSGLSLFAVDPATDGVSHTVLTLHDGPRASEIRLDNAPAILLGREGTALPVITRALEEATLVLAAEAVGVMRRLMHATNDYVRQRRQFGMPIGAFQALQFRLADMAMALEEAEAILPATLEALDSDDAAVRARATSSAKLTIDRACEIVSTGAVQLHGAIGLTDELDVSHAFKRALMIQHELGDTHHHKALRAAA
ncbi:acyl-CoA dehydrogenase family protein [uncultured Brevundimonas sp.]|uniref:acyl-CoA dehydrogenase family protein n=1 Tax=uncultured Brevundimonas sp. TaxID=213418 RepID=UPI002609F8C4|nr:acyl-CoA dehydrogenase family protein [uncultured Brevundimonas sp.]